MQQLRDDLIQLGLGFSECMSLITIISFENGTQGNRFFVTTSRNRKWNTINACFIGNQDIIKSDLFCKQDINRFVFKVRIQSNGVYKDPESRLSHKTTSGVQSQ